VSQFDNDIRARAEDRQQLQADVDAFLAKGGQIQRPETPQPSKPMTFREQSAVAWAIRSQR